MSTSGSLGRSLRPIGVAASGAALVMAMAGGSVAFAQSAAPEGSAPAAGETYTITATPSDTIGTYLAGEDGKTLYFFVPDGVGSSVCTGDCAANWPPFLLEDGEQAAKGDGVTGVVGTIARTDPEGQQVAYDGRPLYYYVGDAAAGDTTGQGLFGKWFAATPDGSITIPAASPEPGASPAPASMAPTGEVYTLAAVTDTAGTLGTYLTGDNGMTLYLLTKDGVGHATCSGDCATNWPAFTLDAGETAIGGEGVTGVIGAVTGADGTSMQVTYDGQPLYYFAGDKAAGDAKGQGKGGVWFVVAP